MLRIAESNMIKALTSLIMMNIRMRKEKENGKARRRFDLILALNQNPILNKL